MDKLLDWVKANAKDGVNVAEFEQLAKGMIIPDLPTREAAIAFIVNTPALNSAHNSAITQAIQTHDAKFTADKLPQIEKDLREKLMAELNPKETPEQKKIRELSEALEGMKRKDAEAALRDTLRNKAKEIGYDITLADRFAVYGEKAAEMLEADHSILSGKIKSEVEAELKKRGIDLSAPPRGKSTTQSNAKPRAEIDAMTPADKMSFFKSGGTYLKEN